MHRSDAVEMRTVLLRVGEIAARNLRGGLTSRDQLRSPAHVDPIRTVVFIICLSSGLAA